MVSKALLLALGLWPVLAFACPETFIEGLASKAFYEVKDLRKGELDGIKIGWSQSELIAYLKIHNVDVVNVIDDEPFFARKECLPELDKVSETEIIYISGKNMKILGKIDLIEGRVRGTESIGEFSLDVKNGLSRQDMLVSLRKILIDDPDKSVYSMPACNRDCAISLRKDTAHAQLSSVEGLEFVSFDGKAKVQAFFRNGALIRLLYTRQRLEGDGVF